MLIKTHLLISVLRYICLYASKFDKYVLILLWLRKLLTSQNARSKKRFGAYKIKDCLNREYRLNISTQRNDTHMIMQ